MVMKLGLGLEWTVQGRTRRWERLLSIALGYFEPVEPLLPIPDDYGHPSVDNHSIFVGSARRSSLGFAGGHDRASVITRSAVSHSARSHREEPGPTFTGRGYLPLRMPR